MTNPPVSRSFQRLSLAAAIAVYALMIIGGAVRITGSGLGCPDWPLCYGRALPPLEITALIEFSHRLAALIAGGLVIATALVAGRSERRPWIAIPALGVIGLLAVQVPLGGVVVASELQPLNVAFHLGMALLIFASSLTTALAARLLDARAGLPVFPGWYRLLLGSALAALFMLLLSGALVVGSGASHICRGWPLCGEPAPPGPGFAGLTPGEAVSMYHRYTVAAVSLLVIAAGAAPLRRGSGADAASRRWALALIGLFAAQVVVGAAQVLLGMPTIWRVLHLATAAGVWACLVALTVRAGLAARSVAARRAVPAGTTTAPAA